MTQVTASVMAVDPAGGVHELVLGSGAAQVDALHRMVGSDVLDMLVVTPQLLMWMDDRGAVNGSAVNSVATDLVSTAPRLRNQVVRGTVVLTGAADPSGNVTSLAPEWAQILRSPRQSTPTRPQSGIATVRGR